MELEQILGLPGIIEIYGEAGAGKTHLALYAASNFLKENPENTVFYISIDGLFNSQRFFDFLGPSNSQLGDSMLIHHEHDSKSLYDFITKQLYAAVQARNVGLLIIDSIAAAFRVPDDSLDRNILFDLTKSLRIIGYEFSCKIIVLNQVAALIEDPGNASEVHAELTWLNEGLKPALGLAWSNCVDHRFYLRFSRARSSRNLICIRSPMIPPRESLSFIIEKDCLIIDS